MCGAQMLALKCGRSKDMEPSVRMVEKTLARLASMFLFLLAKPEFHSHLPNGYPHPRILAFWLQTLLSQQNNNE
jgi:hypothetical protein